jgi:hypothetical protein
MVLKAEILDKPEMRGSARCSSADVHGRQPASRPSLQEFRLIPPIQGRVGRAVRRLPKLPNEGVKSGWQDYEVTSIDCLIGVRNPRRKRTRSPRPGRLQCDRGIGNGGTAKEAPVALNGAATGTPVNETGEIFGSSMENLRCERAAQ